MKPGKDMSLCRLSFQQLPDSSAALLHSGFRRLPRRLLHAIPFASPARQTIMMNCGSMCHTRARNATCGTV